MTKKDLITHVADSAVITKKQAGIAVDAILDGIKNSLSKGNKVSLVGFGTFSVKHRQARTGVKPGSKDKITYPAKNVPKFKAGKGLKDAVL